MDADTSPSDGYASKPPQSEDNPSHNVIRHNTSTILDHRQSIDDGNAGDRTTAMHPLYVRLLCILLDFFTQIYDQVRIVPEIALIKRSVCHSYYLVHDPSVISPENGTVPAWMCREHVIQSEVARLRSIKALGDGLAILITAIPLGILADRYGRRRVIALSVTGPIFATIWLIAVCMGWLDSVSVFHYHHHHHHHDDHQDTSNNTCASHAPIELIWLSSVFYLVGNLSSANASIYAMAADSCPPEQRSRYFYYLYSTFLVCELFAPALVSFTLEKSVLIPFAVGIGALCLVYPVLWIIPETSKTQARSNSGDGGMSGANGKTVSNRGQYESVMGSNGSQETTPLIKPPATASHTPPSASTASTAPINTLTPLLATLHNRNILIALSALFTGALRQGTISVLLQYADARFNISTSRTAMLVSGIAAVNIILFLVALPQIMVVLVQAWKIPAVVIDAHVVGVSLCVLALGSAAMGLARSMAWLVPATLVFAAGYGTRVAVLSLITLWTREDVRASVFGVAQITEGFGRMVGDPLLLKVFDYSLEIQEGLWVGLPFFVASFGFALGAIAWRFVRIARPDS